jgi:hypothetical protein
METYPGSMKEKKNDNIFKVVTININSDLINNAALLYFLLDSMYMPSLLIYSSSSFYNISTFI